MFSWTGIAQETPAKKRAMFIEPELMVGRVVPNYVDRFPNTYLQHGISVNIGSFKTDSLSIWANRLNFPQTGGTLFYSNIGNNEIFGHQLSAMAFASWNVFNKAEKPYYLKLGLGLSYFSTFYDSITNNRNLNVGSSYSWSFQAGVYKTMLEKNGMNLKLGLIFSHASNGHTQLPNLGINSALLSLSGQFYSKKIDRYQLIKNKSGIIRSENKWAIGIQQGLGFHEYGDKDGPVGGPKDGVYSTSMYVSKIYNRFFKWSFGGTYRYYDSYERQIKLNDLDEYNDNIKQSASNLVLFTNAEILMGHVSADLELGFNIYKPFYKQYEKDFPLGKRYKGYMEFKNHFKKLLATRLGIYLYMFNTNQLPKHNLYIGPHIKANAGQADFTEISFGYIYRLN